MKKSFFLILIIGCLKSVLTQHTSGYFCDEVFGEGNTADGTYYVSFDNSSLFPVYCWTLDNPGRSTWITLSETWLNSGGNTYDTSSGTPLNYGSIYGESLVTYYEKIRIDLVQNYSNPQGFRVGIYIGTYDFFTYIGKRNNKIERIADYSFVTTFGSAIWGTNGFYYDAGYALTGGCSGSTSTANINLRGTPWIVDNSTSIVDYGYIYSSFTISSDFKVVNMKIDQSSPSCGVLGAGPVYLYLTLDPNYTGPSTTGTETQNGSNTIRLGTGGIVIVVFCVAIGLAVTIGIFIFSIKKQREYKRMKTASSRSDTEMDNASIH